MAAKELDIHARISVRRVAYHAAAVDGGSGPRRWCVLETTAGRAILSNSPKGLPFKAIDKALKKKEISS